MFWSTFDIQVDITLAIFWKKLQNPQKSLKTRRTYYEITAPWKNEKFLFSLACFFQNKNCWHFEFIMNQIFRQKFIIFENLSIGVNYCWNYGLSKLLLHFTEYRLDQLNNKHTKIAVNSTIQVFGSRYQKKYLLKLWRFLVHPPQNDDPGNLLRNWTETIF